MAPVTAIGTPLIQLDSVDSSNNYAMRQVQAQLAEHGTTYVAQHQTAGKGQRGKQWQAEPGQNLIMSTVVVPGGLKIVNQFYLSAAVALACYDFFNCHSLHYTCIKWPNDIYWKDRKAGGILIENVLQGNEWKYAVIGIGININQTVFDPALQNPVSLKQITGTSYQLLSVAQHLCQCIEQRWQQLLAGKIKDLMNAYNQHLYKKNEEVKLKLEGAVLQARVIGVSDSGELVIDTGTPLHIPFGAVEWIID